MWKIWRLDGPSCCGVAVANYRRWCFRKGDTCRYAPSPGAAACHVHVHGHHRGLFRCQLLPNLGFLAEMWEILRLDGPSCCGVAVANYRRWCFRKEDTCRYAPSPGAAAHHVHVRGHHRGLFRYQLTSRRGENVRPPFNLYWKQYLIGEHAKSWFKIQIAIKIH